MMLLPNVTPENEHRFQCFILFEPASSRVNEFDVLVKGIEVRNMFDEVINSLADDDNIKTLIIRNKLAKVGQMLSLLNNFENVIISKFFDRIWRRYSYISNIGEPFLDLKTFKTFFPQYNDPAAILAQRLDEEDEEDIEGGTSSGETGGEAPVETPETEPLSEDIPA